MSTLHDTDSRGFASDNYAGAHPEILPALAEANGGHQISYGEDVYTARLQEVMAGHLGPDVEVFPVFNGTGANVLSLQSMLPRWGAVICAETAHINTDENGAPSGSAALKLLTVPTPDGKLTPELIDRQAYGWGDEHRAQPLAVSITQTTELGTAYTPDEIRAIADHIHPLGHAPAPGRRPDRQRRSQSRRAAAGVHHRRRRRHRVLRRHQERPAVRRGHRGAAARGVAGLLFLRKMNMQLASKMRFVSAQLIALLEGDLWLRSARHANAMAARLAAAVRDLPGVQITQAVQANAVFAIIDPAVADRLRRKFRFYDWNPATGEVRWMCAFDTTEADIDAFAAALAEELA